LAKVITLLSVKIDYIKDMLAALRENKAVSRAHICTGDFDIVAEIQLVDGNFLEDLDRVLFEEIQNPYTKWINRTVTIILLPLKDVSSKEASGTFRIYSFLNVELSYSKKVALEALEIKEVTEAYPAIGPYDVVVISNLESAEHMERFLLKSLLTIRHVQKSTTLLALALEKGE